MLKTALRALVLTLAFVAVALAGSYAWRSYADARAAAVNPPPGEMVDIGGRRLNILCRGEGTGPTVVITSGLADTAANMWPLQDAIAGFARVCTYDRAGYAWSDPAPAGATMEDTANDLHLLLAKAGIPGPYVLVAHSLSGFYARLFARDHREEVAGVVLIDSSEEGFNLSPKTMTAVEPGMETVMTVAEWAARFGLLPIVLKVLGSEPEPVAPSATAMNLRPDQLRAAHDEIAATRLLSPAMREIGGFGSLGTLPLIVLSRDPHATPGEPEQEAEWSAGQTRLTALSTNSRHVVAPMSGHYIYRDQPDLVVTAVRDVLAAVRDGTPLAPP